MTSPFTETESAIANTLTAMGRTHSLFRGFIPLDPQTRINKDLGMDGDDAVDFLNALHQKFGVDFSDFAVRKYFGPETVGIATIFATLFRGLRFQFEPLTIAELANYIDSKLPRRASDGDAAWRVFCEQAASTLRRAQAGEISLEDASRFFDQSDEISDDLKGFIDAIIWEIGGSPGYYMELLELFERGATPKEILMYVKS